MSAYNYRTLSSSQGGLPRDLQPLLYALSSAAIFALLFPSLRQNPTLHKLLYLPISFIEAAGHIAPFYLFIDTLFRLSNGMMLDEILRMRAPRWPYLLFFGLPGHQYITNGRILGAGFRGPWYYAVDIGLVLVCSEVGRQLVWEMQVGGHVARRLGIFWRRWVKGEDVTGEGVSLGSKPGMSRNVRHAEGSEKGRLASEVGAESAGATVPSSPAAGLRSQWAQRAERLEAEAKAKRKTASLRLGPRTKPKQIERPFDLYACDDIDKKGKSRARRSPR